MQTQDLLKILAGSKTPSSEEFKQLILRLEDHKVLAKVFLLEGTPNVFEKSPMKYVIFREQVADQFNVGSHDVCIVGSAKLGFSPSPQRYGKPFSETSDVDVVVISEPLFYEGSRELFSCLNRLEPPLYKIRPFLAKTHPLDQCTPVVSLEAWKNVKEAIRNFTFENFNPGILPEDNRLRRNIFEKISSTSGLFLALEPQVFVSKIRARIFRTWKSAEDYYSNSLREAKNSFMHYQVEVDVDEEVDDIFREGQSEESTQSTC